MKRIYDSEAVRRDEDDNFAPSPREERRENYKPHSMFFPTPGGTSLGLPVFVHSLLPSAYYSFAIDVGITTPNSEYTVGEQVPFVVTIKNTMAYPIKIPTETAVIWEWAVDGKPSAAEVPTRDPPEERRWLRLDRYERKRFHRTWNGLIQVSETEWEEPSTGTHTISASINLDDADEQALYDEVEFELLPE